MPLSSVRTHATLSLAALLAATAACATAHPARDNEHPVQAHRNSHYLTAQDIKASGARNAWEALRRLGGVRLEETPDGTPEGIHPTRGRMSLVLDDSPIVLLDGARLLDYDVLRTLPARNIDSIELLNGVDGTLRHGSGAGGGAIVIRTRMELDGN